MRSLAACVLLALTTAALIPYSRAQCPSGCFGCRPSGQTTRRVLCPNAGLTAFPVLPIAIQQSLEEL